MPKSHPPVMPRFFFKDNTISEQMYCPFTSCFNTTLLLNCVILQLDSLFHRVKDAHCGVVTPPLSIPVSTPKVSSCQQSSLVDIPPIHVSSPNHAQLNKETFDDQLDKLINFGSDSKDDGGTNSDSDSLENLLESSEPDGEQKESFNISRQFYPNGNSKLQSIKLSDLPGLVSSLRVSPKLDSGAEEGRNDDPLPGVLHVSESEKQLFGVSPQSSTEKPAPVGVASIYTQGLNKNDNRRGSDSATRAEAENLHLPECKPYNLPKKHSTDILATELPNCSDNFYDDPSSRVARDLGKRGDLDDERFVALSKFSVFFQCKIQGAKYRSSLGGPVTTSKCLWSAHFTSGLC